ncbi:MAG: biopolymer transporter ExbD, partial [Burkholderiales bacterium]
MRRPRRAMSEINVVPYIDVMLVLLIIFMVCAPLITPGQIDLPSVGQALNPTVAPLEIRISRDGGMTLVDRQQGGREQSVGRAE